MYRDRYENCKRTEVHKEHRWGGIFDRIWCSGVFKYEKHAGQAERLFKSADEHVKTVNQHRADVGMPEWTPHKHMFRLKEVVWQDTFHRALPPHKEKLEFYCERCPNQEYPAGARVERWKYREMTMRLSKVEQTWPQ